MARTMKEGLEYFPLDVDVDEEVKIIDSKLGISAFGVLIKIWQIIYKNGYYILWTEKELLLNKNKINADIEFINAVINECIEWGIFDKTIYKKYNILTSRGIQKRYIEATVRRKEITFIKELLLTDVPKTYSDKVNVNIISINAVINSKKECNGTQKRREEKKVKESKREELFTLIFNSWNEQKIIIHKSLTDDMKNEISKLLDKDVQINEILTAIQRYGVMFNSQYEYCKYKWSLVEFLKRDKGYKEFLDEGSKWNNYLTWKNGSKQSAPSGMNGSSKVDERTPEEIEAIRKAQEEEEAEEERKLKEFREKNQGKPVDLKAAMTDLFKMEG